MGKSGAVLVERSRHDLTLTRSMACPICTSYTFRATYSFLVEQMYASGECLTCGFERGGRGLGRSPLDTVQNQPNQGQVDTPSVK